MSAAELVFVALAVASLGAAALAIFGGPGRGASALSALALALAGVLLLFAASGPALVVAAIVGAAGLVARIARGDAAAPEAEGAPRGRIAAVVAVLAGLAFVLVGTWARQFVWTGRPLPGSGFGGAATLGQALAGSPGLVVVGLVIVVAAAACAGPPRHRL